MLAIVRVSPKMPQSGKPPFFDSKFEMVKACNESFLQAGECNRIYMLDRCPTEYHEYFHQYGNVFDGSWGKKESLWEAYRVAMTNNDNILFLEDDYLWRPDTLGSLESAVNHFGMVSPYDHPDHYMKDEKSMVEAYELDGLTYRFCQTNTHTFAVRHEIFSTHIDAFYYGLHDWQMFMKLYFEGVRLYAPMYSFATHLVEGKLAPNVDWSSLAEKYRNA